MKFLTLLLLLACCYCCCSVNPPSSTMKPPTTAPCVNTKDFSLSGTGETATLKLTQADMTHCTEFTHYSWTITAPDEKELFLFYSSLDDSDESFVEVSDVKGKLVQRCAGKSCPPLWTCGNKLNIDYYKGYNAKPEMTRPFVAVVGVADYFTPGRIYYYTNGTYMVPLLGLLVLFILCGIALVLLVRLCNRQRRTRPANARMLPNGPMVTPITLSLPPVYMMPGETVTELPEKQPIE